MALSKFTNRLPEEFVCCASNVVCELPQELNPFPELPIFKPMRELHMHLCAGRSLADEFVQVALLSKYALLADTFCWNLLNLTQAFSSSNQLYFVAIELLGHGFGLLLPFEMPLFLVYLLCI